MLSCKIRWQPPLMYMKDYVETVADAVVLTQESPEL